MKCTGFEKVSGYMVDFFLRKEFGKHSELKFKMSVRDDEANAQLEKVGQNVGVMLDVKNPVPVFFGEITSVTVERKLGNTCIEVSAVSDSAKIDSDKHTRIFQNPDKTFADILTPARLKIPQCKIELATDLSSANYKNILVQNQETDFEFINRLARYANKKVWINDTKAGQIVLKVADCADDTPRKIELKKIISCRIGREKNLKIARIETQEYFPTGALVQIENYNCKYLVNAVEFRLVHGSDRFFYELEEFTPRKIDINPAPLEKTIKFKAKITNTADEKNLGRVQVKITDAEDEDSKKSWLPYRTPYSGKDGGFVFIPDVGDTVEVIFANGDFFVCSALRENALQKDFQNVADKYIANNSGQKIFFKQESLEIVSAKNKILLDKDKIELTAGDNKILLSGAGIEIKSGSGIEIKSGSGTEIKAGSDIAIKTGKDVNISGANIKLS